MEDAEGPPSLDDRWRDDGAEDAALEGKTCRKRCMIEGLDGRDAAPPLKTPGVASSATRWSLRTRLGLLIALAIALVIGATTYVQSRVVERTLESELVDAARLTALAVADDLQLRNGPFNADEMRAALHEFIDAMPELGSISVITLEAGSPVLYASTSSSEPADALKMGRRAITAKTLVWGQRSGSVRILAVPLVHDAQVFGAVAVTVSFDTVYRLRNSGRVIAVWSTVISVAALFILVELLVRYFIHRPIGAILGTVRDVSGGVLSARVPPIRDDEIGAVADGLNAMFDDLESLHTGLQQRVAQATEELRVRNRDLLSMYQEMFALREELGRAQQLAAVGETTSAVAHQIGTPLNLVSGHIQLLIEEQGPESPVSRRLRVAEEQIGKVTSIVRDLLARSRRRLARERIAPRHLISRLCTLVQPAVESAGVDLVFEPADVPDIDADLAQLELALLNLVSNALDAMPEGGRLTIRLTHVSDRVVIAVEDTGAGMSPELVERAFDPWVTTKPPGRGTGLGLSIARTVIVEHGGHVTLTSSPGRGTIVLVDLPAVVLEAKEVAAHD
jgi:signal transduction histidine kinase